MLTSRQPMRIAQISTLATPVRRHGSGSVEGIAWVLTQELTRLGHEVTVFAAAASDTPGRTIETLPGPYGTNGAPGDWQACEWINLCRALERSAEFDVIHAHAYLWSLPLEPLSRAAMVHTLHVMPDENALALRLLYPDACVSAPTRAQWSAYPAVPPARIIGYGIDIEQFTFNPVPGDYLVFFGRFTHGKGPLHAIAAARAVGMPLVLSGPANDYFRRYVEPRVDGSLVRYVGAVSGRKRDELLGGARALLYPLQEPEPFGVVQGEAMLCGTPVVAPRIGACEEIVDDGVTGCLASSIDALPEAVRRVLTLDRRAVRGRAEERFSPERMAVEYAALYAEVVAGGNRGAAPAASARRAGHLT